MTKGDNLKRNEERERKLRRLQRRPSARNWLLKERHLLMSLRSPKRKRV